MPSAAGLFTNVEFENSTFGLGLTTGRTGTFNIESGIEGIHCVDLHGRIIPRGVHYVPPGPDECMQCVCDEGGPQLCRAMLCQPPQLACKLSRVGTSCCDFICLGDDYEKGNGPYGTYPSVDMGVVLPKIIITALLSMLSLSLLFFLVNRLRQRELQGRQSLVVGSSRDMCDECDDTRSLDFSVYDFDRRSPNAHLFPPQYMAWWKPTSGFFPRQSEAPPPYEEAIITIPSTTNNGLSLLPMGLTTMPESIETENQCNLMLTPAAVLSMVNDNDLKVVNHDTSSSVSVEMLPLSLSVSGNDNQEEFPGPSSRILPLTNTRYNEVVSGRVQCTPTPTGTDPSYSNCKLPAYSAVDPASTRVLFRRSLTLPRRPNVQTEFGDLNRPFERNQQQRYSLQLQVVDWSSSNSSLSLSPSTPILGLRDDTSTSSSSTSTNSTE